jgi:hypothetical protein
MQIWLNPFISKTGSVYMVKNFGDLSLKWSFSTQLGRTGPSLHQARTAEFPFHMRSGSAMRQAGPSFRYCLQNCEETLKSETIPPQS